MRGEIGPIGTAGIGAACAIFDGEGRVLLVKHTYGHFNWEIPGGIALPGEAPSRTAMRELEEETGLVLPEGDLSGVYYEAQHPLGGAAIHFVFRYTEQAGLEPRPTSTEIGQLGWYNLHDLPAPLSDFTERRIRDALAPAVAYAVIGPRTWRE